MKKTLTAAQRRTRATKVTASSTFYVTGIATIGANMYASEHTFIGLVTGFWTPVALFLALEMVDRVHLRGRLGILRKVAVGFIAVVAAWVSYWHLVDIFTIGGADIIAAHAMPLTVDLLMALARTAMVTRPTLPVRRPARKQAAKPTKLKSVA